MSHSVRKSAVVAVTALLLSLLIGCLGPIPTVSPISPPAAPSQLALTAGEDLPSFELPQWIRDLFTKLVNAPGVRFISAHILLNVAMALAAGLICADFDPKKLAEFLYRKLLPYVGIYYVLLLVGETVGMPGLAAVAFSFIEATLLSDFLDNWERAGLPLPQALRNALSKIRITRTSNLIGKRYRANGSETGKDCGPF